MTRNWQDISVALDDHLPIWPDSPGVVTTRLQSIDEGDAANVTQLSMDVHSGTHVDAPRHFIDKGATLDELGLHPFLGPATVIDTGEEREIDAAALDEAAIPDGVERLLLRTANTSDSTPYHVPFDANYAALTCDGAEWIAARRLHLVGIDYLSIARYPEASEVHLALLAAGVSVLEGLDLSDVAPGEYDLICLPINLQNVEAAPARAVISARGD